MTGRKDQNRSEKKNVAAVRLIFISQKNGQFANISTKEILVPHHLIYGEF